MNKVETFLYALSFLMPIGEDETLTAYRAYSKALEKELKESKAQCAKLKKQLHDLVLNS